MAATSDSLDLGVGRKMEERYAELDSCRSNSKTNLYFSVVLGVICHPQMPLREEVIWLLSWGKDHRIIGLEGSFKAHLVQPLCNEQGHLQLAQVAHSPVQPDLEFFQGWGIYHLSGQPMTVFHHPHPKTFLPYI